MLEAAIQDDLDAVDDDSVTTTTCEKNKLIDMLRLKNQVMVTKHQELNAMIVRLNQTRERDRKSYHDKISKMQENNVATHRKMEALRAERKHECIEEPALKHCKISEEEPCNHNIMCGIGQVRVNSVESKQPLVKKM